MAIHTNQVILITCKLCEEADYWTDPQIVFTNELFSLAVSDQFGFGLLDADALTENAKKWRNVGQQLQCRIDFKNSER